MGRPKGARNLGNKTVREMILADGFNPISDMIKQLPHCAPGRERFECAEKLARFIYPTMKSIELTGEITLNAELGIEPEAIKIIENIRRVKK